MSETPRRSRIEADSDDELEIQEEVIEVENKEDVSIFRRFWVQIPAWKEHLGFYDKDYYMCVMMLLLASIIFILGITEWDHRATYHSVGILFCALDFFYFWLRTPEGPPMLGDEKGNKLEPKYKRPRVKVIKPLDKDAIACPLNPEELNSDIDLRSKLFVYNRHSFIFNVMHPDANTVMYGNMYCFK